MVTVEVATFGAGVALDGNLLRVDRRGHESRTFALDDLDLVVLQVPAVTATGAALAALARRGIPVMLCDEAHRPVGWVHGIGATPIFDPRRAMRQAALGKRTRDRLWRAIVRSKIERQADVLELIGRPDARLRRIARDVEEGDLDNCEAHAARIYWSSLFGGDFRRRGDAAANAALDWGYTILRSITCRAIVAAGLHPAIGLHHVAPENPFNLSDDLLEPYRPLVDRRVLALSDADPSLSPAGWRPPLAQVGEEPVSISNRTVRCRSAIQVTVASLARIIDSGKGPLDLPSCLTDGGNARRLASDVAADLL